MEVKVFGVTDCTGCKGAIKKFEVFLKKWNIRDLVRLRFLNMDTVDGLAEGAYYEVVKPPTVLIEKDSEVLARWDGEVPRSQEFKKYFEDIRNGVRN